MKKNILILLILCSVATPAMAMQTSYSDGSSTGYGQIDKPIKIYNSSGSLSEYRVPQNNKTVRTYNKYHQYTGYYKRDGSKIKYHLK